MVCIWSVSGVVSAGLRDGKELGMKLLSRSNAKTIKGEVLGWRTAILHLAPADSSGLGNVCPNYGPCRDFCTAKTGRGHMPGAERARLERTRIYFEERARFYEKLFNEVESEIRSARRAGMKLAIRINGTSDLVELARLCTIKFPDVQWYDYTKVPKPWTRSTHAQGGNYHLTYSLDAHTTEAARAALDHGINVAVPFDIPKGKPLPSTFWGRRVIDGDINDLRFLDPKGVIVGLRYKTVPKQTREDAVQSGFVQIGGMM